MVGTQVTLAFFDDPNDDGLLFDSVRLASVTTVLTAGDLNQFVTYAILTTTVVRRFFVAMYIENGPGGPCSEWNHGPARRPQPRLPRQLPRWRSLQ